MIFTLKINDSESQLIFTDLFHMDSESELLEKLFFLDEMTYPVQEKDVFKLEIGTLKETVLQVYLKSISEVQQLKERIYDAIIEKQEEYLQQNRL